MADIFLSYTKADRTRAQAVVGALEEAGFSVWWDDRLTPLQTWDKLIEREIADAKAVLVLWTKASHQSDSVRSEATFGKENGKLVQARLEDCTTPLTFILHQRAELIGWEPGKAHEGWSRLVEWLSTIIGTKPEPDPKRRANEELNAANFAYWTAFDPIARERGVGHTANSLTKSTNYYHHFDEKKKWGICAYLMRSGNRIGAYPFDWDNGENTFSELVKERAEIQAALGMSMFWSKSSIGLTLDPANADDQADWQRQHLWMSKAMEQLKALLQSRMAAARLSSLM